MIRLRFCLFLFVLAITFATAGTVKAGELDDIYRLADEKKLDQAMSKLDAFLKEHPRDAQARFLQGLIYTGKSRNDDAIRVFQELGAEFPDLPEPFNNLAVLYAERGDYEKAREALVNAIRILPDYATAHENLGDIHAKLASQSYAHALRINNNNTYVSAKLTLMKKLFVLPNTPPEEMPSVAAVAETKEDVKSTAFEESSSQVAKVSDLQNVAELQKLAASEEADRAAMAAKHETTTAAVNEPSTEMAVETNHSEDRQLAETDTIAIESAIEQRVYDWARAWSARNTEEYLSFYAASFKLPKKFRSRGAWEKQRRRVLGKAGTIRVTLTDVKAEVIDENRARVTMTQSYWSPRYQDQIVKIIDLIKEDGIWKFQREYS